MNEDVPITQPQVRHPMDAFFALPMMFWDAALANSNEVSQLWWSSFFRSSHHHPDGHAQLELPEPLEAAGEHDLFA
ncbi:MAG: hypothetical protein JJE34_07605 [Alphaproteobacteria bacterium]|nr:hypothetical protein [Alphaproteobacteria bacterium]